PELCRQRPSADDAGAGQVAAETLRIAQGGVDALVAKDAGVLADGGDPIRRCLAAEDDADPPLEILAAVSERAGSVRRWRGVEPRPEKLEKVEREFATRREHHVQRGVRIDGEPRIEGAKGGLAARVRIVCFEPEGDVLRA